MGHFFISYKREDEDFVDLLDDKINEAGYTVWRDKRIKPGEEWKKSIDNAIENCIALILIITPHALKSQYVTYEWSYAMGNKKTVIPIILKEPVHSEIHPKLPDRQWINFEESEETAWHELYSALEELTADAIEFPNSIHNALGDLDKSDVEVRRDAIIALENNDNPLAVEALRRTLQHDFLDVRFRGALAFAKRTNYEDFDAIPAIEEGLRSGNFTGEREAATKSLGYMSCEETTAILLSLLRDSLLRSHAQVGLYVSEDPQLITKLYSRFDELSENIEKMRDLSELIAIIQILSEKKDTNSVGRLLALIDTTEHDDLALIAASNIAQLGAYDQVRPYVLRQLEGPLLPQNVNAIRSSVSIISKYEYNKNIIKNLTLLQDTLRNAEGVLEDERHHLQDIILSCIKQIEIRAERQSRFNT